MSVSLPIFKREVEECVLPIEINKPWGVNHYFVTNVACSVLNAIRRTILSEVETIAICVKESSIDEGNKVKWINSTESHNEIIERRLKCIPVHFFDNQSVETLKKTTECTTFLTEMNMLLKKLDNYELNIDVTNETSSALYVTTKDFVVKKKDKLVGVGNVSVSDEITTKQLFPADEFGYYIELVALKPKISEELETEQLKLTAYFSSEKVKTDGCYNVAWKAVSIPLPTKTLIASALKKKKEEWAMYGIDQDQQTIEEHNFHCLDAKRCIPLEADKIVYRLSIASTGAFENIILVKYACCILIESLKTEVKKAINTIRINEEIIFDMDEEINEKNKESCYSIDFENETIAHLISDRMYSHLNEYGLIYCSHRKMHPDDTTSTLKVVYSKQKFDKKKSGSSNTSSSSSSKMLVEGEDEHNSDDDGDGDENRQTLTTFNNKTLENHINTVQSELIAIYESMVTHFV